MRSSPRISRRIDSHRRDSRGSASTTLPGAVGKMPRASVVARSGRSRSGANRIRGGLHTGLALPAGMRAVALPVSNAAQAVGGAIVPGARVDVIAVPVAGRAPGGRTAELLLQGAMVLDVRSETGSPYGAAITRSPVSSVGERIGSVVVAIDARRGALRRRIVTSRRPRARGSR